MRFLVVAALLVGCNDLRDFAGTWDGRRVGDDPVLRVGVSATAHATLAISQCDTHAFRALLSIDGLLQPTELDSIAGVEADALSDLTFAGSPLRVFMAFVPMTDGHGDAVAVIGLFDDHRIDVRIMRQGDSPVYAIFAFQPQS